VSDSPLSKPHTAPWYLYILRCNDLSLYTGITKDLERRLNEHQQGGAKGAKSLRGKGPLQLVFTLEMDSQSEALQLEYRIKQLTKPVKEQLVSGAISIQSLFFDL
jgi:putative endonuclease